MNTFAIISILFILSINNFCFIFLLFISSKKHIFNIYLTFHFFYSISLLILIIIYYFFIVYNIFDIKYNENYFYINYIFFSFFNNFTISICLSCLFLCIGSIPFTLGFYIKLFSFFIYLNYIGISVLYFCIMWLIVIYTFYFKLIVNLFVFSYQGIGFWVVKLSLTNFYYCIFMIVILLWIIILDAINILDLII
jgi:hypothetical protein